MNKKSEAYKNIGEEDYSVHVNEGSIGESLKEVPSLLKGLFTNPTFIFIILATACDTIIVGGFSAFGPKYVEYQFSVPASTAGILFGNTCICLITISKEYICKLPTSLPAIIRVACELLLK